MRGLGSEKPIREGACCGTSMAAARSTVGRTLVSDIASGSSGTAADDVCGGSGGLPFLVCPSIVRDRIPEREVE